MAPAGFEHGAIGLKIASCLLAHVQQHRLGVVVGGETGFVLARNPDIVRGADAAFVRADRIPAGGNPVKFWDGPPDLAVEVVSPGDTLQEVEEKVDDYLNAGTRMVWVINPRRRTVTVSRSGTNPVILRDPDVLDGQNVVPGFSCKVAALFT
jgi:Uma2 family endonuclease